MNAFVSATLQRAFVEHERFLWSVCYRMTGTTDDADDLVQDTFARALERPPKDAERTLRPWLTKIAVNLSRDRYRRRRREKYGGDWLPAPIEILEHEPPAYEPPGTEARYDLLESVSMAFLVALEALGPNRRAVLLLRDVFDYSVAQTASALETSEANVKTTLHRARKQMAAYDRAPRVAPAPEAKVAMEAFVARLAEGDVAGIEALLCEDVVARSDGGGRYHAANKPVVGATKVAKFLVAIAATRGAPEDVRVATLNATPAIVARFAPREGFASHVALLVEFEDHGRIRRIYSQLVDEKLSRVRSQRR